MNSSDMELFLMELEYELFDSCDAVDEDKDWWTRNRAKSVKKSILEVIISLISLISVISLISLISLISIIAYECKCITMNWNDDDDFVIKMIILLSSPYKAI